MHHPETQAPRRAHAGSCALATAVILAGGDWGGVSHRGPLVRYVPYENHRRDPACLRLRHCRRSGPAAAGRSAAHRHGRQPLGRGADLHGGPRQGARRHHDHHRGNRRRGAERALRGRRQTQLRVADGVAPHRTGSRQCAHRADREVRARGSHRAAGRAHAIRGHDRSRGRHVRCAPHGHLPQLQGPRVHRHHPAGRQRREPGRDGAGGQCLEPSLGIRTRESALPARVLHGGPVERRLPPVTGHHADRPEPARGPGRRPPRRTGGTASTTTSITRRR